MKLPHAGKKITRTILKPDETIAIANRLSEPYSALVLFLAVEQYAALRKPWALSGQTLMAMCFRVAGRIYDGKEGTTKTESSSEKPAYP